jgi:hypothetical protein
MSFNSQSDESLPGYDAWKTHDPRDDEPEREHEEDFDTPEDLDTPTPLPPPTIEGPKDDDIEF